MCCPWIPCQILLQRPFFTKPLFMMCLLDLYDLVILLHLSCQSLPPFSRLSRKKWASRTECTLCSLAACGTGGCTFPIVLVLCIAWLSTVSCSLTVFCCSILHSGMRHLECALHLLCVTQCWCWPLAGSPPRVIRLETQCYSLVVTRDGKGGTLIHVILFYIIKHVWSDTWAQGMCPKMFLFGSGPT